MGRNGQVAANISAREIVVLGKVRGNVSATDRVDIRAEGSLSGDVAAARISIEDGAFFKGGIDIRKPDAQADRCPAAPAPSVEVLRPVQRIAAAPDRTRPPRQRGRCAFGRSRDVFVPPNAVAKNSLQRAVC